MGPVQCTMSPMFDFWVQFSPVVLSCSLKLTWCTRYISKDTETFINSRCVLSMCDWTQNTWNKRWRSHLCATFSTLLIAIRYTSRISQLLICYNLWNLLFIRGPQCLDIVNIRFKIAEWQHICNISRWNVLNPLDNTKCLPTGIILNMSMTYTFYTRIAIWVSVKFMFYTISLNIVAHLPVRPAAKAQLSRIERMIPIVTDRFPR